MRVLAVSTNDQVLDSIAEAFGDADVDEVASPPAALARLDGDRYDVVLADADTTPEGGFSLARNVGAREEMGADVPPVVLLIARVQDRWLAEWSGADLIALRPVDPFDLRQGVDALLSGGPVPELPDVTPGGGPMREEARRIEREGAESAAGGFSGGGP